MGQSPEAGSPLLDAAALKELLGQPFRAGSNHALGGSHIAGALDLSGMTVSGFDLTGAVFSDPVIAKGTRFVGLTWLRECNFLSGADFSGALFAHDARFDGTVFKRDSVFSRAEFRGIFCLDRAEFQAAAFLDRLQVSGSLSAAQTRFRGTTSLENSECMGGLWFADTRFDGRCNLLGMEVHGRTWLRGARAGAQSGEALARTIASYGYSWV